MKVGIIASNILPISKNIKKGTELFVYLFVENLVKLSPEIKTILFASGDSQVAAELISVNKIASFNDPYIGKQHHKIFELALLARAFREQDKFDLFHAHIGNGEVILPFAPFVKKPIVITLHGSLETSYRNKYYPLFKNLKNVYFISISNAQRKNLPDLNYYQTIYDGIDTNTFTFGQTGGEHIVWAGRGIPEKGLDEVLKVMQKTNKTTKVFIIRKEKHSDWLKKTITKKAQDYQRNFGLSIEFEVSQIDLASNLQKARLLLFPIRWEEPFGMVMVEAMACGTPVVAYARGSVPEVIKDGETGFIVNSSGNDLRGDWIVKKTGIDGLIEAVERIYSMPEEQYQKIRKNCREHVEKNFTVERMVKEYIDVYNKLVKK